LTSIVGRKVTRSRTVKGRAAAAACIASLIGVASSPKSVTSMRPSRSCRLAIKAAISCGALRAAPPKLPEWPSLPAVRSVNSSAGMPRPPTPTVGIVVLARPPSAESKASAAS